MGCERRVLLAFSGGNDSCAAVGILRARGYEPTLLTLDMTGDRSLLARARRAAEALDTPLLTADVRTSFTRQVVDYFASGYLTGETPAPCTECNSRIKWNTLRDVSIDPKCQLPLRQRRAFAAYGLSLPGKAVSRARGSGVGTGYSLFA